MSVIKNDKVVLVKGFESLNSVGETYEVANVTSKMIVLRDVNTKIAVAAVSFDEFDLFFKKKEEIKSSKWTQWQTIVARDGSVIAFYRTNYKKVQVKTIGGKKGEATCSKDDEFSLSFGITLSYLRCVNKDIDVELSDLANAVQELNESIKELEKEKMRNNDVIHKMLRSLESSEQNEIQEISSNV